MTSDWDAMWAKPFDDGAHYATKHLVEDAAESFLDGKVTLHCGDMLAVLPTLAENSVDSCVTDPPYHLVSIVKRFGADDAKPPQDWGRTSPYQRAAAGFMGQKWDGGGVAFEPETWAEVYRVLKPGGHLLAFGGTRTYHRMACAIEDAGFEIRDCIMWVYGSGFPKSHNVAVAIDKANGVGPRGKAFNMKGRGERAEEFDTNGREFLPPYEPATPAAREWSGWGTALKPACEPIVVARKPLGTGDVSVCKNVEKAIKTAGYTGEICWIDESAVCAELLNKNPASSRTQSSAGIFAGAVAESPTTIIEPETSKHPGARIKSGMPRTGTNISNELNAEANESEQNFLIVTDPVVRAVEKQSLNSSRSTTSTEVEANTEKRWGQKECTQTSSDEGSPTDTEFFAGIATGLTGSMAHVRIKRQGNVFVWPKDLPKFIASKPLNVASNVLRWGVGALNIDATRIATDDKLGGGGEKAETAGQFTNEGWRRPWMDDPIASEAFAAKVRANVQKAQTLGRWPANLVHDGSDEVVAAFPQSTTRPVNFGNNRNIYGKFVGADLLNAHDDSGSAARFFYTAKADQDDRLGSKHPTVKPVDLMQWLVRLVTPRGGLVLDPFAGTGTTGEAAWREGMRAVLIEREAEYQGCIRRRMALALAGPDERTRETIKAAGRDQGHEDLPLFGGA